MLRRARSHLETLSPWRPLPRLPHRPHALADKGSLMKKVEDVIPIATGIAPELVPFGTKILPNASRSTLLPGHIASLKRIPDISSKRIPGPFHQYLQYSRFFSSRILSAGDVSNMEPISSPLTPLLGDGRTKAKDAGSKPLTVQAIKKGIKQSPKKVNLVAKLVRGMRVEDALLQLQVTVKRAAKTVYQVIHSARANAAHNHGLDPDRLLVAEAFVGKGLYLKRLSYHAKGRSGIMVRPRSRLTVVVRETTPEEEAKIAKLRVSNYKKLTRTERQLVPHQLIESTPRWGRKRKEAISSSA